LQQTAEIMNAPDRVRLHQAKHSFARTDRELSRVALMTIEGDDLRASRVFI